MSTYHRVPRRRRWPWRRTGLAAICVGTFTLGLGVGALIYGDVRAMVAGVTALIAGAMLFAVAALADHRADAADAPTAPMYLNEVVRGEARGQLALPLDDELPTTRIWGTQ